jgi:putative transposase
MQVFGLPANVNRLGSYALRQEAQESEIAARHKLLGDWERLKRLRVPDADIATVTGLSRATYYRRKRALALYGTQGLARRSQRPKRFRQSAIPQGVRDLVLQLRRQHHSYGKAKLTVILARDHGIALSESTIGRILTNFMRRGLVPRYAAATRIVRKRKFDGHARRWAYDLRPKAPGEMIQVDHMSVNKHTSHFKHFQAWDPITRYTHAEIYTNATSANAASFLERLQQALPFPVRSIQVDGGSEFMKDFEAACQAKGIPLYVLPPKRPQYNGGVERMNRTMRDDLYARKDLLANSIADFREAVKQATHTYNYYRPHQKLDNLTPAQYLAKLQAANQSQML